jgi:hypothetical protein
MNRLRPGSDFGLFASVGLIVLLRVSGKRTLTKMNAFDLAVTVALGLTLTNNFLSRDVALAEALLIFAVLIALADLPRIQVGNFSHIGMGKYRDADFQSI